MAEEEEDALSTEEAVAVSSILERVSCILNCTILTNPLLPKEAEGTEAAVVVVVVVAVDMAADEDEDLRSPKSPRI